MRRSLTTQPRRLAATFLVTILVCMLAPSIAWGVNQAFAVTFLENASPSDSVSTFLTENTPTDLTLFANLSPAFSDSGYVFSSWNTSPSGGGVSYGDGALYSFTSAITLYAQWTANVVSNPTQPTAGGQFTVSFNNDGATGVLAPITVSAGGSVQLPLASALTYTGFTLTGWYTAPTGGTFVGGPGITIVPPTSLALYAQWKPNVLATVTFAVQGSMGSVAAVSAIVGSTVTLPSGATLINTGYTFEGWSTSTTSQGVVYAGGTSFVVTSPITLYALWTVTPNSSHQSVLAGAIGPFSIHSSSLTVALKNQIQRLARSMKLKGYVSASMIGYSLASETRGTSKILSTQRAQSVVNYLRSQLAGLNIKAVTMQATGEGDVKGETNAMFRRVEIFLKL